MSDFYLSTAAEVDEVLAESGQPITVTKKAQGGAYNPATGKVTGGTPMTYTCNGMVYDFGIKDIDGTLIKVGDKKIMMSAVGVTVAPEVDDLIAFGTSKCVIKRVNALDPAGIVVYYDIQARGV